MLLLVDLHRDLFVDLLEGIDITLYFLAVFGESGEEALKLLLFRFERGVVAIEETHLLLELCQATLGL